MSDHPQRRFTPPWDVEDNGAAFIVRDVDGQALSYVYYENEPGPRAAVGLLTRDVARSIALNVAKLPDLLRRPASGGTEQAPTVLIFGPRPLVSQSRRILAQGPW